MISKYALAKESIAALAERAGTVALDPADVLEALIISTVQELKVLRGPDYLRGILQYEVETLGSGGVFEIARGLGHS